MEIISGHVLSNLKRIEGNCGSPIDVDEVEEVEVAADEEGSDEEKDENEDEVLRGTYNKKNWILMKKMLLRRVIFTKFMNMMITLLMIIVMTNL